MPAPPTESLDAVLEQAEALMEDRDYRRAILCYRRAQALAPFRQDIRDRLAEAIDGRLSAQPSASLEADFAGKEFARVKQTDRVLTPHRAHQTYPMKWIPAVGMVVMGFVVLGFALWMISFLRGTEGATGRTESLGSVASPETGATSNTALGAPSAPGRNTAEGLADDAERRIALNQFDDAEALLDEAVAMNPADPARIRLLYSQVFQGRGRRLYDSQRYSEAVTSYERAAEYDPNSAEIHYSLGWCHYYLGLEAQNAGTGDAGREALQNAVASFRQSIELNSDLAKSYRGLGQALMLLQDREGAFAAWRRAVEIDPDGADGQRARRFLESHNVQI